MEVEGMGATIELCRDPQRCQAEMDDEQDLIAHGGTSQSNPAFSKHLCWMEEIPIAFQKRARQT